jgi:predicted nucleic acid-binding protein
LDDLNARTLAKRLNIRLTGALGIIHKAKQLGLIDKVKPLIDKLLLTNFRISEKIIEEIANSEQ